MDHPLTKVLQLWQIVKHGFKEHLKTLGERTDSVIYSRGTFSRLGHCSVFFLCAFKDEVKQTSVDSSMMQVKRSGVVRFCRGRTELSWGRLQAGGLEPTSEEPADLLGGRVQVDVVETGSGGQTGHGAHLGETPQKKATLFKTLLTAWQMWPQNFKWLIPSRLAGRGKWGHNFRFTLILKPQRPGCAHLTNLYDRRFGADELKKKHFLDSVSDYLYIIRLW